MADSALLLAATGAALGLAVIGSVRQSAPTATQCSARVATVVDEPSAVSARVADSSDAPIDPFDALFPDTTTEDDSDAGDVGAVLPTTSRKSPKDISHLIHDVHEHTVETTYRDTIGATVLTAGRPAQTSAPPPPTGGMLFNQPPGYAEALNR